MNASDPTLRRKSRLLVGIAGFFLIVPVLVVGIALYGSFDRPPDLAVDLPTDPARKQSAFRARVQAGFPAGTPEDALVQTLTEQGFALARPGEAPWSGSATIKVGRLVCASTYAIRWRTDEAGNVIAMDADARRTCP